MYDLLVELLKKANEEELILLYRIAKRLIG